MVNTNLYGSHVYKFSVRFKIDLLKSLTFVVVAKINMPEANSGEFSGISIDSQEDFTRLFHQYYPILLAFSRLYISDRQQSEDLVQEFFVHLWNNRDKILFRSNPKAYLFSGIKNRSLDYLKRKNMMVPLDDTREDLYISEPEIIPSEKKDRKAMAKAILARLSPQARMVFILVRFESYSYAEVSGIMDISIKTVENHMGRALKALRDINQGGSTPFSGDTLLSLFLF